MIDVHIYAQTISFSLGEMPAATSPRVGNCVAFGGSYSGGIYTPSEFEMMLIEQAINRYLDFCQTIINESELAHISIADICADQIKKRPELAPLMPDLQHAMNAAYRLGFDDRRYNNLMSQNAQASCPSPTITRA